MCYKNSLAVMIAVLSVLTCSSRNITGTVVDADSVPMEFVNVVLMDRDSVYLSGTITDIGGKFSFDDKGKEEIKVKFSYIGYEPVVMGVSESWDVGVVIMHQSGVMLNEVIVKADKPRTKLKNGVLVTTVEKSVLQYAGTAGDVLAQVPMVTGRDGEFEVFGKGTPIIYINNRKLRDNRELSELNSADIKSVEVVTNPGTGYDASVKSVIRISTRRPQGDGFSMNLRSTTGFARYFRAHEQVGLKYRSAGLEIFSDMSYYGGRSHERSFNDMTSVGAKEWRQVNGEISIDDYDDVTGKIGVDYMFYDKHSAGAYYRNGINSHETRKNMTGEITSDGSYYDIVGNTSRSELKTVPMHLANVYYNGRIGNMGIDLNADYMWNKHSENVTNYEQSDSFDDAEIKTISRSRSRLFAEKLAVRIPLLNGELEVGQEFAGSRFETGFGTTVAGFASATTQVNEENTSIFVNYSRRFGRFNVSAGLRCEHVSSNYKENGVEKPEQSKAFCNLFPSLSASTEIGNVNMNVSYTSKTSRPNFSLLDGTVNYINRFVYGSGNPYLLPTISHSAEIVGVWSSFFAKVSYRYDKNPIYNATQMYPDNETVRLITYTNFPDTRCLDLFVGTNQKIGMWQPSVDAGVIKQWLTVPYNGGRLKLDNPMPMVSFRNALELPSGIWLNVDLSWRGRGDAQNLRIGSSSSLDVKLYKAFCGERFSVTVEAMDVFNENHERLKFCNGDVTINAFNRSDSRSVFLTLQYRFNVSNNRYSGSGAGNIEKARLQP